MNIVLTRHIPGWLDFISLTKPRVVMLHLLTAAAAMFVAAGGVPHVSTLVLTLLAGALMAGSSNVFNCYFDRDIDAVMTRTRKRPLATGRLMPAEALIFGTLLGLAGLYIFIRFIGWMTAVLAAGALFYYVVIYTLWLKRHSSWSAVFGSGAGAFPPLIGWMAVTGRIEAAPFLLFAIVALWSPPHFWSLALSRQKDYQDAGLGVLPPHNTAGWILLFALLLFPATLLVAPLGGMGPVYTGLAFAADIGLIVMSACLVFAESIALSRLTFLYSIAYLAIVFGGMIADRLAAG